MGGVGSSVRWRRLAAGAVLLVLLGSCGGEPSSELGPATDASSPRPTGDSPATDPDTATSTAPDACGVLTSAEVASATGLPFGEGQANVAMSDATTSVCDWRSDDPYATAQVLIVVGGDLAAQRASVEEAFEEPTVDVDLGEAAYRTQEGSLVAMRIRDLFVQVSYIPPGPGDVTDITVALAGLVAGRL